MTNTIKNLLKALLCDIEIADRYMEALTTGWLMGKQAQPLFGLDWSTLWATPLADLRASLHINVDIKVNVNITIH
jgi:ubiquinone biosynthesis protein COQ4